MAIHFLAQEKHGPNMLSDRALPEPLLDFRNSLSLTAVLSEGVTKSTEPSIMLISTDSAGTVILQIPYSDLVELATKVVNTAESNWRWPRPEGFANETDIKRNVLDIVTNALS